MAEYEQTRQLLDEFGLTAASQRLDAQLDEAARTKDITYLGFLYKLLMTENEARKLKAQEERLRQSKLPSKKRSMNLILIFSRA